MRVLSLRLLGVFGAYDARDDRPIPISGRKMRMLLAYLAMQRGAEVPRETLADLFWGNNTDDLARQSLRQALVGLRRTLAPVAPEALSVRRDSVSLRDALVSVDAVDFAERAERQDLACAAALYRGEFLTGFGLESAPIADWVQAQRNRYASLAATVFQLLAERYEAAGEGKLAIAHAERLVEIDGFREDWQRVLLRLYARYLGRQRALSHARKLTGFMRRELDVDPEAATLELLDGIRRGAWQMTASALHSGQDHRAPTLDPDV